MQNPHLRPTDVDLDADDFTHPLLARVWAAVDQEPAPTGPDAAWLSRIGARLPEEAARSALNRLAVEQVRGDTDQRLIDALLARLQELTTRRRIEQVKSRLQRTNPVDQAVQYNRLFGELVALEQHRRALRDRAIGAGIA